MVWLVVLVLTGMLLTLLLVRLVRLLTLCCCTCRLAPPAAWHLPHKHTCNPARLISTPHHRCKCAHIQPCTTSC